MWIEFPPDSGQDGERGVDVVVEVDHVPHVAVHQRQREHPACMVGSGVVNRRLRQAAKKGYQTIQGPQLPMLVEYIGLE